MSDASSAGGATPPNPGPVLGCMPADLTDEERKFAEIAAGIRFEPYQGSVRGECSECGRPVWVGPAQQRYAALGALAVCLPCVARSGAAALAPLTSKRWGQ